MQNPVAWHLVATVKMKVLGVWNLEDIFLDTTRESHVQESYHGQELEMDSWDEAALTYHKHWFG